MAKRSTKPETTSVGPAPGRVAALLKAAPGPLFAVLDAARDPRIHELVEFAGRHRCLYSGRAETEMARLAPHLLAVEKDGPVLEKLAGEGWGKAWGVYLSSAKPFDELRDHLRRFLPGDPDADPKIRLRFYDPRSLRAFLAGCSRDDAETFFGPVSYFVVEDRDPLFAVRFAPDKRTDNGADKVEGEPVKRTAISLG
jgi:hypothetical protein